MHTSDDETYIPLTLARFGIRLVRMTEEDKEIVRLGRNKDFVRNNHLYRSIITEAEQERWFVEMNSREHYVFIVIYKGKRIGVVYLRDIPEDLSISTCGLFFWEDEYISSRIPVFAAFLALDFAVYFCEVQQIKSIVLKTNEAGLKMYTFFGFELKENDAESYVILISREIYLKRRETLINFILRAVKNTAEHQLRFRGSQCSLNYPVVNQLLAQFSET